MSSPDTPVVSEEPLVLCYYVGEGAWPGPWVDHVVVATVFFFFSCFLTHAVHQGSWDFLRPTNL